MLIAERLSRKYSTIGKNCGGLIGLRLQTSIKIATSEKDQEPENLIFFL